jgi:upstream activation factor subunit UAF30
VKYTKIIDSILDGADLTTITRKSIRQGIQDEVSYDISKHKVGVTADCDGVNAYHK